MSGNQANRLEEIRIVAPDLSGTIQLGRLLDNLQFNLSGTVVAAPWLGRVPAFTSPQAIIAATAATAAALALDKSGLTKEDVAMLLAEFMFENGIIVTSSGLIVKEEALNDLIAPQALSIAPDGNFDYNPQGIPIEVKTSIPEITVTAKPIKNGISIPITVPSPYIVPIPATPAHFPDQEPANEPPKVPPVPLPDWEVYPEPEQPELEEFKTGQHDMIPPSKYWEIFPEVDPNPIHDRWRGPRRWPDEIPNRKLDQQLIPQHALESVVKGKDVPVTFEEPTTKPANAPKKLPKISMAMRVGMARNNKPTIELAIRVKPDKGRAEENKLRKDKKSQHNVAYMALLHFINKTYGTVSEVIDFYEIFQKNLTIRGKTLDKYSKTEQLRLLTELATGNMPTTDYQLDTQQMQADILAEAAQDKAIGTYSKWEKEAFREILDEFNLTQLPTTTANQLNQLTF